jgi:hemagglutinin/hemolysin family protein
MSKFFETEFGQKIVGSPRKTKKKYDGQIVYEVMKKVDKNLSKGDYLCLDGLHMDHFKVFDKRGNLKSVLNLDGTLNTDKLLKVKGRKLH